MAGPARRTPLDVSKVFSVASNAWKQHLAIFVGITALVTWPGAVAPYFIEPSTDPFDVMPMLIVLLISMVTQFIATAAITWGVFEHLAGRSFDLGGFLRAGVRSMWMALSVGSLYGILLVLGLLLCIIPGLFVASVFFVAVPAGVVERKGIGSAFNRSIFLTRGSRLPIVGLCVIYGLIYLAAGFLVTFVFGPGLDTTGQGPGSAEYTPSGQIVAFLLQIFLSSFVSTVTAATYFLLRRQIEGLQVEDIASVFD
ncbi:MAG: hypothetical protein KDB53_19185 [Planctomycetes bacterium]|nr:hypothetical protein [Planctomycetota bacterium]